jgi:hypothetical protein
MRFLTGNLGIFIPNVSRVFDLGTEGVRKHAKPGFERTAVSFNKVKFGGGDTAATGRQIRLSIGQAPALGERAFLQLALAPMICGRFF